MKVHRILFVTSGATGGGAERQLIYLLRLLDRHLFEPTVLTVLSPSSPLRMADRDFRPEVVRLNIPVRSLDADYFASSKVIWNLAQILRKGRWDIVQTFGLRVDLMARLALANLPIRLVASIRNTEDHRGKFGFLLEGLTSGRVNLYISNTAVAKEVFARRAGILPDKILVIPNGIDAEAFVAQSGPEDRERRRREWGVAPDDILAVTVANLTRAKGHEDIIAAAGLLTSAVPNLKFAFCGADRLEGKLQQRVGGLGLEGRVLFLGHRDDIPSVLRAADIFLLASHWEGMPNGILEAMAMGLPVVATRVGGVPEVAAEGETAILAPPRSPAELAQALQRLTSDQALGSRLGQAGYAQVRRRFTLERMAARTQAAYLSLLGGAVPRFV